MSAPSEAVGERADARLLRFGDFQFDVESGRLTTGGEPIALAPKPADLLTLLLTRPGRVIGRDEILARLWGNQVVEYDQCLNSVVRQLRSALKDSATTPQFIETIPKRGYRFIADVAPLEPASRPSPWRERAAEVDARAPRRLVPFAAATALIIIGAVGAGLSVRIAIDGVDRGAALSSVSLAVHAFDAPEGENAREAQRFTADLRAALSGQTSDARLSGGSEGGATHEVAGVLARRGDLLLANVELRDASDRALVWSRRFSRPWSSDAPTLLAHDAAAALSARLDGRRAAPAGGTSTPSQARQLVMRGRHLLAEGDDDSMRNSLEYFRRALESDPSLAPAHVGVAHAQKLISDDLDRDMPSIRRSVETALRLDDSLAWGYAVRGSISLHYDRDLLRAMEDFRRAATLTPNEPWPHAGLAECATLLGDHEEAMAHMRRAVAIAPTSAELLADGAWYHFFARRYDEAVEWAREALTLEANHVDGVSCLLYASWKLGRFAEAHEFALRLAALQGVDAAGHPHALDADPEARLTGFFAWRAERRRQQAAASGDGWTIAARSLGLAGDVTRALDALEAAERRGEYAALQWIHVDPRLDPLRDEPRFAAIVERHRPRPVDVDLITSAAR